MAWVIRRVDSSPAFGNAVPEMEAASATPESTKAMEYVQSADFFPGRASGLGGAADPE